MLFGSSRSVRQVNRYKHERHTTRSKPLPASKVLTLHSKKTTLHRQAKKGRRKEKKLLALSTAITLEETQKKKLPAYALRK